MLRWVFSALSQKRGSVDNATPGDAGGAFTSQDGNRAADVRRRRPARSFEASRIFRDANVLVIRALRKRAHQRISHKGNC